VSRLLPPALLLLTYGIAFGRSALGGGLLAFDDHPGQLYRIYHAVTLGWAPWRLNTGWWAGYAELQYYPPGAAWLGAAIHQVSMGVVDVPTAYQAVLWIAWLLPGLGTFALLTRILRSGWLALPGALVALTLSAGSRSGVEEGLRWGLVSARLGWGLLPLVTLSLAEWVEGRRRIPLGAAPLVAAVILLHPAHAPAALLLLGLGAWLGEGARVRRLAQAGFVAAVGLGLAGLWLVPLLAHLDMALPLAWGDGSAAGLLRQLARPLLIVLVLAQAAAWLATRAGGAGSPAARWLFAFTPAMAALVAIDALVLAPLGILWLPADRLADSLLLALVLGASLGTLPLAARLPRLTHMTVAMLALGVVMLLSAGSSEPALSLWPLHGQWPKYDEVVRGTRIDALWSVLAQVPPGRVLFLRSALHLDDRREWWWPHSHITALTPVMTGRQILNGTFTHPSPIAGLLYSGSSGSRAIRTLVEERDGRTLFGRPLESLGVEEFSRWAGRLRVSAVVATDDERGGLAFLDTDSEFAAPRRIGPFRVYLAKDARPLPEPAGSQRWRVLPGPDRRPGERVWIAAGLAYSPLWQAESAGRPLSMRRDAAGMLEVDLPPAGAGEILLTHSPGAAEAAGVLLTTVSSLVTGLALLAGRARKISG
jgi:6-pyruvoyl-tetrahydropterin synthase-like protein